MVDLYGALEIRPRLQELRAVHVQPRRANQVVGSLHVHLRDPHQLNGERAFRVLQIVIGIQCNTIIKIR